VTLGKTALTRSFMLCHARPAMRHGAPVELGNHTSGIWSGIESCSCTDDVPDAPVNRGRRCVTPSAMPLAHAEHTNLACTMCR
jgi:hypothetical protein